MRVLITGANGKIGQQLVNYCIQHQITCIATSIGKNQNPLCPDYLYFPMDICNKLDINRVMDTLYPTHIFHAAAISSVNKCAENPALCWQVNVEGTALLFQASQQFEAHFKLISWDMTKNEDSAYSKSKMEAQKKLELSTYKNWSIVDFNETTVIDTLFS